MKRPRYQFGTLYTEPRKSGPDVWAYRWRETNQQGSRPLRKQILGAVPELPTQDDELRAAEAFHLGINRHLAEQTGPPQTVRKLVEHYRLKETPMDDHEGKRRSTKLGYIRNLENHIVPRWGDYPPGRVTAVEVEEWLKSLDFTTHMAEVLRSYSDGAIGPCKTEISEQPVPLDEIVLEGLRAWRPVCGYPEPGDWVFASDRTFGKTPLWPDSPRTKVLQPTARRVGVGKRIGRHTYRRTYSSLLAATGDDVKVVQELMRHAKISTRAEVYAQAGMENKRAAQRKAVDLLLGRKPKNVSTETAEMECSHTVPANTPLFPQCAI